MKRPAVLAAVLLVLGAAYAFATRGDKPHANALEDIKRQVAVDAIKQYEIAKRHGNACAQASLVKAAVLQAQDEPAFAKWTEVERAECPTAP